MNKKEKINQEVGGKVKAGDHGKTKSVADTGVPKNSNEKELTPERAAFYEKKKKQKIVDKRITENHKGTIQATSK